MKSRRMLRSLLEPQAHMKVRVPEEVSVVAFTNADWCAVSNPPLTTYEVPLQEMGLMAAQLMLNRVIPNGRVDLKPSIVSFVGKIVERSSATMPR